MPPISVSRAFPIVTIKLKNIEQTGSVGPNVRFRIQVSKMLGRDYSEAAHPVILGGLKMKDRFIAQAHWNHYQSAPVPVYIHVHAWEKDPVHDDGPYYVSQLITGLRRLSPPFGQSGTQKVSITVQGKGGDKKKSATFDLHFEWFVTPSVYEVVNYIFGEMQRNTLIRNRNFRLIKGHLDEAKRLGLVKDILMSMVPGEPNNHWTAYNEFRKLVQGNGDWDHKPMIREYFHLNTLDPKTASLYDYELWSNIHYGYVGKTIGFSENVLLEAAGIAQAVNKGISRLAIARAAKNNTAKNFDDPEDQIAIKIGFNLVNTGLSKDNILNSVRWHRVSLAPGGVTPAPASLIPPLDFYMKNLRHYRFLP